MPLLVDTAELAGLVVEGCLYGIFCTLITITAYGSFRAYARNSDTLPSHTWPVFIVGTLLFLMCTGRIVVNTTRVFVGFFDYPDRVSRIEYFNDVKQFLFTAKHSFIGFVLFIGDGFVNWRCWVVWGKDVWVIVPPVLLSVASLVCGSWNFWAYWHLASNDLDSQLPTVIAFYILSLASNATSTGLLAYRIYTVRKFANRIQPSTFTNADGVHVTRPGRRSLKPVLLIVLESGMLNAAYLFIISITLLTGSSGFLIMDAMSCPLTGIIFVIFIIRVSLYSQPDAYWPSPKSPTAASTRNSQPMENSHVVLITEAGKKVVAPFTATGDTSFGNMGPLPSRIDLEMGNFQKREYRFYGYSNEGA